MRNQTPKQWRQDIETLTAAHTYLTELSKSEAGLIGETWQWRYRLEEAASLIERYKSELEHRITNAVAERLDESPLPPDKWVEQPDGSFLPSPICPKQ